MPDSAPRPERRACVRLASNLSATCRPARHSKAVSWPGKVRDVSRGGLGLLMRHRFRHGTRLTLELRASTGALLGTVSVMVVHTTAVVEDSCCNWLLGCAFDPPLSEDEFHALL